jgi:hypothetical protein
MAVTMIGGEWKKEKPSRINLWYFYNLIDPFPETTIPNRPAHFG